MKREWKAGDKAFLWSKHNSNSKYQLTEGKITDINLAHKDDFPSGKTLSFITPNSLGTLIMDLEDSVEYLLTSKEVIKPGTKISISLSSYLKGMRPAFYYADIKDVSLKGEIVESWPENCGGLSLIMFDEEASKILDEAECGISHDNMGNFYQESINKYTNNDKQLMARKYSGIYNNLLTYHLPAPQNQDTKPKETTMSKIVDTLKADGREAAYRVAGTQITAGVKAGIIKLFENKGGDSAQMDMLRGLLDSEMGDSLVSLLLGYGLNYAPKLKDDARIQKLSEEFRINGMAVAGSAIVDAAMGSFLPVISKALAALPEETTSNARISEGSEEEEEDEDIAPVRSVKAASR